MGLFSIPMKTAFSDVGIEILFFGTLLWSLKRAFRRTPEANKTIELRYRIEQLRGNLMPSKQELILVHFTFLCRPLIEGSISPRRSHHLNSLSTGGLRSLAGRHRLISFLLIQYGTLLRFKWRKHRCANYEARWLRQQPQSKTYSGVNSNKERKRSSHVQERLQLSIPSSCSWISTTSQRKKKALK